MPAGVCASEDTRPLLRSQSRFDAGAHLRAIRALRTGQLCSDVQAHHGREQRRRACNRSLDPVRVLDCSCPFCDPRGGYSGQISRASPPSTPPLRFLPQSPGDRGGCRGSPCSAVGWEKGHVTGQTDHAAPSPDRWHTRTQIRKTASNGSLTALHGERRTHLDRALVAYTTTPQRSTRPVLEQRQQRRRLRNSS